MGYRRSTTAIKLSSITGDDVESFLSSGASPVVHTVMEWRGDEHLAPQMLRILEPILADLLEVRLLTNSMLHCILTLCNGYPLSIYIIGWVPHS